MSKSEERALEAYPYSKGKVIATGFGTIEFDQNHDERVGFIKGYNQAEQDLMEKAKYSQEPANEDFESEWKRYCDSKGGGAVTMNVKDVAKHFVEWQKEQDKSRRKANIALANTDVPKDKELEIAFEDIWSDVEDSVPNVGKLPDDQKYKLKNAHHDTFEAGSIWQKKRMLKYAIEATALNSYYPTRLELNTKLNNVNAMDEVKVIIIKE